MRKLQTSRGKSPPLLQILNSWPFTSAVVAKTQQTQGAKNQETSPIEPYTKIPVVLFSTPQSRKIITNSVKIAHAEKWTPMVHEFSRCPKNGEKNDHFLKKTEPPSNSDFREKVTNKERTHSPETLNTISTWAYSQNLAARRPQDGNKLNSIGICAWGPGASEKEYIAIGTCAFLRWSAKPTESRPKTRQKGRNRCYLHALLEKTGVALRAREKTRGFSRTKHTPVQFNIVQNAGANGGPI